MKLWPFSHAPLTRPPTPSEAASALSKASHAKHRAHVLARAEELRRDTAAGLVAGRGR
jgi:hypothetical protein